MSGCRHCPDGHAAPASRPWGVYVADERDGDGQPTHLRVSPADGAHVAQSDADWLWRLIRGGVDLERVGELVAEFRAEAAEHEHWGPEPAAAWESAANRLAAVLAGRDDSQ